MQIQVSRGRESKEGRGWEDRENESEEEGDLESPFIDWRMGGCLEMLCSKYLEWDFAAKVATGPQAAALAQSQGEGVDRLQSGALALQRKSKQVLCVVHNRLAGMESERDETALILDDSYFAFLPTGSFPCGNAYLVFQRLRSW